MSLSLADAAAEIVAAGRRLDARNWVPATSGNLSRRLPGGQVAITRSGVHKGDLALGDIIEVGVDGRPADLAARPSAETALHCQLYAAFPEVGAVLHGHSVAATVLSLEERGDRITLAGYEILKAFGVATHDITLDLPLFPNDQDIDRLARLIAPRLADCRLGYVIAGHGTYVWAADMAGALARFEALEFLLSCELERRRVR